MGGNLMVLSKENYGFMFFFVFFFRVDLGRFKSFGWLSDEVYEMMINEVKLECVNERLVLIKKIGYFYFILKVVLLFLILFLNLFLGLFLSWFLILFILWCCSNLLFVDVFMELNFL